VKQLFGMMMRAANAYDPDMLWAIKKLRAAGKHRIIALTNNFSKGLTGIPTSELAFLGWAGNEEEGTRMSELIKLFDDFCDSSALGMR